MTPAAISNVPFTLNRDIALTSDGSVCVINSFEFQVFCTDQSGNRTSSLGRRGAGPGEFLHPGRLLRGPNDTMGVVDFRLNKMSIFQLSGELVSEVGLPGTMFSPSVTSFDSSVMGTAMMQVATDGPETQATHMELIVASGEIAWKRIYRADLVDSGCQQSPLIDGLVNGVYSPTGQLVFFVCDGQMLSFLGRDALPDTLLDAPTYTAELPNNRDLESYRESLRTTMRAYAGVQVRVDAYGRRAKPYSRGAMFDEVGRLWVLTTKDQDLFSYLDIYENGQVHAGTIRVPDRVVGFDIIDTTLVALLDWPVGSDDVDLLQEVNWYDITDLGLEW
ncbi:MAG: hypothetical protein F4X47_04270 [Gammaproteobacteria bacterium]|nr:hypothetical protein [Gammaproteobacteria bacterium]